MKKALGVIGRLLMSPLTLVVLTIIAVTMTVFWIGEPKSLNTRWFNVKKNKA